MLEQELLLVIMMELKKAKLKLKIMFLLDQIHL